jgi:hypothetical protein
LLFISHFTTGFEQFLGSGADLSASVTFRLTKEWYGEQSAFIILECGDSESLPTVSADMTVSLSAVM